LLLVLVGVTVVSFWGAEQVVDIRSVDGGKPGEGRVYVECRPDGVIVHPHRQVLTLADLDDPQRWGRSPFGRCLAGLSSGHHGGSVYFLVRPKGLTVYRKALTFAFAAGGGTADAVAQGRARFAIGQQMVFMPGPVRVAQGQQGGQP